MNKFIGFFLANIFFNKAIFGFTLSAVKQKEKQESLFWFGLSSKCGVFQLIFEGAPVSARLHVHMSAGEDVIC